MKKNAVWGNAWLIAACALMGILNALGHQMYYTDHLPSDPSAILRTLLSAVLGAGIGYLLMLFMYPYLHRAVYRPAGQAPDRAVSRKWFWLAFGIILLGWLVWIVAYYPASAERDVYYPIRQYLGLDERSSQQPWFYTCTVGFFYSLGLSLGDKNVGIFLYIVLRAIVMSGIYAWLIVRLHHYGIRKWLLIAVILFYAVVPVWGAYAKHAFKDTQCAAFFCLCILMTVECVFDIRAGKYGTRDMILYSAAVLLMSLYRNTCIYVAAPVTVLLGIAILRQKRYTPRKKGMLCFLIALGILVYGGWEIGIRKFAGVHPAPMGDVLSVPLQQTARTVRDHGEEITEEEREAISAVLAYDRLAEDYDPLIADPVKAVFMHAGESGNGARYIRTWLRMMFRFPVSYLESALAQSYGYYAFTPDQAPHAGNENCGMTIFNWTKDGRYPPEFTLDYQDSLEGARTALDDWAKIWHQIPFLGWTDVKALYTWTIVFLGAVLLKKKEWGKLIPICAFLLMILSCCVSPVNDCFRYFVPVAAAFPAILLLGTQ